MVVRGGVELGSMRSKGLNQSSHRPINAQLPNSRNIHATSAIQLQLWLFSLRVSGSEGDRTSHSVCPSSPPRGPPMKNYRTCPMVGELPCAFAINFRRFHARNDLKLQPSIKACPNRPDDSRYKEESTRIWLPCNIPGYLLSTWRKQMVTGVFRL